MDLWKYYFHIHLTFTHMPLLCYISKHSTFVDFIYLQNLFLFSIDPGMFVT